MAVNEQKITQAESGGNRYERNPRSSAYGPGQFLSSTWLNMVSRYRPDLMQGRSRDELLELRSDPSVSAEMTKRYGEENGRALAARGIEPTEGNIYLAHFAGPAGARKLLQNPEKPAADVLGPEVIAANPFLANWKAQDVADWANRKMGWSPVTGAPAALLGPGVASASAAPAAITDAVASAAPSAAPKPKENDAVLPFLASLFGGGGAAAGAAGGLGSALGGAAGAGAAGGGGGLLSSLFSGGGFDPSAMMGDAGQPAPANPLAGQPGMAPANPLAGQPGMAPMSFMPRTPVNMQGLQAMLAQRQPMGNAPNMLR